MVHQRNFNDRTNGIEGGNGNIDPFSSRRKGDPEELVHEERACNHADDKRTVLDQCQDQERHRSGHVHCMAIEFRHPVKEQERDNAEHKGIGDKRLIAEAEKEQNGAGDRGRSRDEREEVEEEGKVEHRKFYCIKNNVGFTVGSLFLYEYSGILFEFENCFLMINK